MCKFLTNKHAEEFRPISRSIRIHGHSTSLRLEACFWRALDEFARGEGVTTPKLIETLYAEICDLIQPDAPSAINLASTLRTACLVMQRAPHGPDGSTGA